MYTPEVVEAYKRETREVVRRFLLRQLSFPDSIAALDAALAGRLPHLRPEQLDQVRGLMLANNATIREEMAKRSQETPKGKYGATFAKHWYIDCKKCGRKITLETYTGEAVFGNRLDEKLTCPDCLKESTYSGDDFKTAEL